LFPDVWPNAADLDAKVEHLRSEVIALAPMSRSTFAAVDAGFVAVAAVDPAGVRVESLEATPVATDELAVARRGGEVITVRRDPLEVTAWKPVALGRARVEPRWTIVPFSTAEPGFVVVSDAPGEGWNVEVIDVSSRCIRWSALLGGVDVSPTPDNVAAWRNDVLVRTQDDRLFLVEQGREPRVIAEQVGAFTCRGNAIAVGLLPGVGLAPDARRHLGHECLEFELPSSRRHRSLALRAGELAMAVGSRLETVTAFGSSSATSSFNTRASAWVEDTLLLGGSQGELEAASFTNRWSFRPISSRLDPATSPSTAPAVRQIVALHGVDAALVVDGTGVWLLTLGSPDERRLFSDLSTGTVAAVPVQGREREFAVLVGDRPDRLACRSLVAR
jgi:hypothetical protein